MSVLQLYLQNGCSPGIPLVPPSVPLSACCVTSFSTVFHSPLESALTFAVVTKINCANQFLQTDKRVKKGER